MSFHFYTMVSHVTFEEFAFAGQKTTEHLEFGWSAPFPLALKTVASPQAPLGDLVSAIKEFSASGKLFELVKRHGGAVLIRGLPIKSPQDYSEIAHAFGFKAHEEVGRPPMRTVLAKNIKTANEG